MMSRARAIHEWLRRIVPDLFLAAVVALLVTFVANYFEGTETRRINDDLRAASGGGLTLDEHVDVLAGSIRRSALLHLPLLAVGGGAAVGLACRNRRWAWLTAVGAVAPTLLWVAALFIDRPVAAATLAGAYVTIAVIPAVAVAAARGLLRPPNPVPVAVEPHPSGDRHDF